MLTWDQGFALGVLARRLSTRTVMSAYIILSRLTPQ